MEQREATAWGVLAAAPRLGTLDALQQATAVLQREAPKNSTAAQYRSRVIELTQILNESVGAEVIGNQDTSLNLKTIDTPISNAQWLQARCAAIASLQTETQRLSAIDALVNSTSPGPHGFCKHRICFSARHCSTGDVSCLLRSCSQALTCLPATVCMDVSDDRLGSTDPSQAPHLNLGQGIASDPSAYFRPAIAVRPHVVLVTPCLTQLDKAARANCSSHTRMYLDYCYS